MFGLLRKFGWIGGLVVMARTPQGQRAIAKVKAYAKDPETRRKFGELRAKVTTRTDQ